MSLEKNRHISIQLYFTNNSKIITSEELSALTRVSSRTIKKDIQQINDSLKRNGAEIISKKSEGYFLEVNDQVKFESYKTKLEMIEYYRTHDFEFADYLRLSVIIRILLMTEEKYYVKMEDLENVLLISKSTLQKDMQKAIRFLESYHINVVSKPNYGTKIIAEEKDIRMAMLSVYGFSLADMGYSYVDEPFFDQFICDKFEAIRKIVLDILRESKYTLRDEIPNGLIHYLVLSKNRLNLGYPHIKFTDGETTCIDNTNQMKISKRISEELKDYGFQMTKNETRMITVYLMINHDYSIKEINSNNYGNLASKISNLFQQVKKYIGEHWDIKETAAYIDEYLFSIISRITIRKYFNMLPYGNLLGENRDQNIQHNQLELKLAFILVRWLEDKEQFLINSKEYLSFAFCLSKMINQIFFNYNKLNVVTVSPLGIKYANILVENINNYLGKYISKNEAMELYEIRGERMKDIDLVLFDNNLLTYYNYDIPYYNLNDSNLSGLQEYLRRGYDINQYCDYLCKCIETFEHFDLSNREAWFEMLSFKHCVDTQTAKALISYFQRSEEKYSYAKSNSIVLLFAENQYVQKDIFEIYRLKERKEWSQLGSVKYILFVSFNFGKDSKLMKVVSLFIKELSKNKELLDNIIQGSITNDLVKNAVLSNNNVENI